MRLGLSAHDHPLNLELGVEILGGLQVELTEHLQIRNGHAEDAARHEHAPGLAQRGPKLPVIPQMLVDMACIDLDGALVGEDREVGHA